MRRILQAIWLYGLTILFCLGMIPLLLFQRRIMASGVASWARLQTWGARVIGGVRIEVRGAHRMPAGAVLVAAKHQSFIDIISPFTYLTDPAFVLKKELTEIPLFGNHALHTGHIPVDREAGAKALKDMMAVAEARIAEGRPIIIFPEGTRKAPGEAPDYKPGVAAIYREAGLVCVPVATNAGAYFDSAGLIRRPGVAVYEILDPIPAGLKRGEFMRELQTRLEAASSALLEEAQQGP